MSSSSGWGGGGSSSSGWGGGGGGGPRGGRGPGGGGSRGGRGFGGPPMGMGGGPGWGGPPRRRYIPPPVRNFVRAARRRGYGYGGPYNQPGWQGGGRSGCCCLGMTMLLSAPFALGLALWRSRRR